MMRVLALAVLLLSACDPLPTSICRPGHDGLDRIRDTALVAGRALQMRAVVQDGCGEALFDAAFRYSSSSPAVAVTEDGRITGVHPGRAEIEVRVGDRKVATAQVSVVPEARLSFVTFESVVARIVTMDLDGSNQVDVPHSLTLHAPVMAWSDDRAHLAVSGWNGGNPTTYIRNGDGSFESLLPAPSSPVVYGPVFSPDGEDVYTYDLNRPAIYRVNVETRQVDTVFSGAAGRLRSITVSPDGNRLAFLELREEGCCTATVHVLDLGTRESVSFPSTAGGIRWSPVNDSLAIIEDDAVKIMAADGSGKRILSDPNIEYFDYGAAWPLSLEWSPDGKWIIAGALLASQNHRLDVIEVATGLTIPLEFSLEIQARAPFWLE
jgi:Tol biopolymer transport system component